jgi:hypothetical protein
VSKENKRPEWVEKVLNDPTPPTPDSVFSEDFINRTRFPIGKEEETE